MGDLARVAVFLVEPCDTCRKPATALVLYLETDGDMTASWVCDEHHRAAWVEAGQAGFTVRAYGGDLQ